MNVEAKVLSELSEEGYASGEAISQKLNITRSAVWKHIVKLRERGYIIEASPRRGYRLAGRPDKLLPAEIMPLLATRVIGSRIVHLEETTSTADEARRLIESGAADGTVVVAERQTSGRGRLGRAWQTAPSKSVAMSIILYPPFMPTQAPLLSLATGLAAARAIQQACGLTPQLKWPNDIYLEGRKLGGVLVEMAAELDRVVWMVDSIGINVNNSFAGTQLAGKAISLREALGRPVVRRDVTVALIGQLDGIYCRVLEEGFGWLKGEFRQLDMLRGRDIEVTVEGRSLGGRAEGIDDSGRLLLRGADGTVTPLFSGEATLSRAS